MSRYNFLKKHKNRITLALAVALVTTLCGCDMADIKLSDAINSSNDITAEDINNAMDNIIHSASMPQEAVNILKQEVIIDEVSRYPGSESWCVDGQCAPAADAQPQDNEVVQDNTEVVESTGAQESGSEAAVAVNNNSSNASSGMRGIWVASVVNIDYPKAGTNDSSVLKAEADAIINNCEALGMNNIFLQVRPASDALYKSDIFPWSKYLTGQQGLAPSNGFDPLAYFISTAHAKGIKVHAWLNPYRVTKNNDKNNSEYNALADNNPAKLHPEYLIKFNGEYYYDPAIPEVRQLVIDGIKEIVRNYDIDGIHFDDYFYPSGSASGFNDDASYAAYGGGLSRADFRRDNVNKLVKSIRGEIRAIDPNCVFGISPCGIWANNTTTSEGSKTAGMEAYTQLFADTRKWVKEEWIDYIAPQVYWEIGHSKADYEILCYWWANQVKGTSTKLYIGMGDYRTVGAKSGSVWAGTNMIKRELQLNESIVEISGEIHYNYNSIVGSSGLSDLYKSYY